MLPAVSRILNARSRAASVSRTENTVVRAARLLMRPWSLNIKARGLLLVPKVDKIGTFGSNRRNRCTGLQRR